MSARTDIHRPSAPEFDPTDYVCVGVFYLGESADQGWTVGCRAMHREAVKNLENQGITRSGVYGSRQCSHCGASLSYAALMLHEPTKTYLHIGEDCLDNRFELDSKAEFQALRKEQALNRKRMRKADQIAALVAEHPLLTALLDWGTARPYGEFVVDVGIRFRRDGQLSERQIETVESAITRSIERAHQAAIWENERREAAIVAPLGRCVVTGKVGTMKLVDGYFEDTSTWKMLVVADEGYRVWATVPSSLNDLAPGMRVRFTATLTLKKGDPNPDTSFVIGTRPTKAEILDNQGDNRNG